MLKVGIAVTLQSVAPRCVFLSRRREQHRHWTAEQTRSGKLSSEEEAYTSGDTSGSEDIVGVSERLCGAQLRRQPMDFGTTQPTKILANVKSWFPSLLP